jgi:hypothetical protein
MKRLLFVVLVLLAGCSGSQTASLVEGDPDGGSTLLPFDDGDDASARPAMPVRDGGREASPTDGGQSEHDAACVPSCDRRTCGPDGCGGSCGTCASGTCGSNGHCACTPKCSGRACGPDGCGGSCGTCPAGSTCDGLGHCAVQCTPFCGTRVCGSDGCGGSCGSCTGGYTCGSAGTCQNKPGTQCGNVGACGSAVSCCKCNGTPICYELPAGYRCKNLGTGCGD